MWHARNHCSECCASPRTRRCIGACRCPRINKLCRQVATSQPLDVLLRRVNSTLRGWSGYFRAGVSSAVFSYLSHYTWKTMWRWLLRKHRKLTRTQIRRRYFDGGWWPATENR
ncbi:group II intron maturase-specific domain-containing protein [Nocardia amikacinitolerans]|uniref:group II intron maturase-specific domain-containing protein n=1 Tax=Nocardia amikacinitolerans TaxID=756689 RepID=UPI0020A32C54|nr:group II intron maturase-specific domain-containing protein [Nocardia amikacinitolerans]